VHRKIWDKKARNHIAKGKYETIKSEEGKGKAENVESRHDAVGRTAKQKDVYVYICFMSQVHTGTSCGA
jgi:hypothetical protein